MHATSNPDLHTLLRIYITHGRIRNVVSSQEWRRLSARQGTEPAESLLEGVPTHLYVPVLGWVAAHASDEVLEQSAVAARLPLPSMSLEFPQFRYDAINRALNSLGDDQQEKKLLDLLDAILAVLFKEYGSSSIWGSANALERLLELGGSAWRVNAAGNGLERRVDKAVANTVEQSMKAAQDRTPSAATHLADAWKYAYSRSPDPTKVFSESIKAVEAAAAPIVTPNDLKATLGKIIGEMKNTSSQWKVGIAHTTAALPIQMMESLWNGQTDRHGGVGPTIAVTSEAAEASLHLAATLVHWFSKGAVSRK